MKSTFLDKKIGAIIPAAGRGKRMGGQGNKLLLELAKTPILLFTLQIFEKCSYIAEIIIPAALEDIEVIEKMVKDYHLQKVSKIIVGGKERQDSVFKALQMMPKEIDKVIIHDGARPLLELKDLKRFIEETQDLAAAVMAVPLKDTVKVIDEKGWVRETIPREKLCLVQTPQIFERQLLEESHQQVSSQLSLATDDATLLEQLGYPVKIITGSYDNIKITTPEDILIAEAILQQRQGGSR